MGISVKINNTLLNELYNSQIGLNYYFFTAKNKIPEKYKEKEEIILWYLIGFYFIVTKLFANQPPPVYTDVVKDKLKAFFLIESKTEDLNLFENNINKNTLLKSLIENNEKVKCDEYLIDFKKKFIKENQKRISGSFKYEYEKLEDIKGIDELENRTAKFKNTKEVFYSFTSKLDHYSEIQKQMLNLLISSEYFYFLDFDEIVEIFLCENKLNFSILDQKSKGKIANFLKDVFPYLSEKHKKYILDDLQNKSLPEFRELSDKYNYSFDEFDKNAFVYNILNSTDKEHTKRYIEKWDDSIYSKKPYYIEYNLANFDRTMFKELDNTINKLIKVLEEVVSNKKQNDIDLWEIKEFRIVWIICAIWFKWQYNECADEYGTISRI